MGVNELPSGKWRGQVYVPRLGQTVTVVRIIGGHASFASKQEANKAVSVAKRRLKWASVEDAPYVTLEEALMWTEAPEEDLAGLIEMRVIPCARTKTLQISEPRLAYWFGLRLPGPATLRQPGRRAIVKPPPSPIARLLHDDRPHWLYRFFDVDGALLYIGITNAGVKRMEQHGADKHWWPQVRSIAVDHFPDRATCEQAEREAIWEHRPKYNVIHNPAALVIA